MDTEDLIRANKRVTYCTGADDAPLEVGLDYVPRLQCGNFEAHSPDLSRSIGRDGARGKWYVLFDGVVAVRVTRQKARELIRSLKADPGLLDVLVTQET